MARSQRISYFPLEKMDPEMLKEMERCRREGTPRPESSAVRAHVPAASVRIPARGRAQRLQDEIGGRLGTVDQPHDGLEEARLGAAFVVADVGALE